MKKWILVIAVLAVFIPAAHAQSELQTLKTQVAQMQRQLDAVEQNTSSDSSAMGWWNRINWSGDFRFRSEAMNDDEYPSYGTRYRNRLRARIKMLAHVNEEVDVIVRLASGESSTPTSANQTLTGQFSEKDVWLDQMYLVYSPEALVGFDLLLGKMEKPFMVAGGNQMIWDSDVMFEGGAIQQTFDLSDETQVVATGGGFWLDEYWGPGTVASFTDQYLMAVQAYVKQALDSISDITAGASYYDYMHVQNQSGFWTGGNSTPTTLINDFDLLEFFAQLDTMVQEMPLCVYGTYVQNLGTVTGYNQDTAWLAGVKVNKLEDPGSWQFGYNYREVEKDAVMGFFTHSTFVGGTTGLSSGGTGSSGHEFKCSLQAMRNVVLAASYVMAKQETTGMDYDLDRLIFDCIVKIK